MLLAYAAIQTPQGLTSDLCLIPYESNAFTPPVPVRMLTPESAAVFYIGPKEAVQINTGDEPNSIMIEAVPPATLYITPDSPNRPGTRAQRIKLVHANGNYRTYYCKDNQSPLQEWVANKTREQI